MPLPEYQWNVFRSSKGSATANQAFSQNIWSCPHSSAVSRVPQEGRGAGRGWKFGC